MKQFPALNKQITKIIQNSTGLSEASNSVSCFRQHPTRHLLSTLGFVRVSKPAHPQLRLWKAWIAWIKSPKRCRKTAHTQSKRTKLASAWIFSNPSWDPDGTVPAQLRITPDTIPWDRGKTSINLGHNLNDWSTQHNDTFKTSQSWQHVKNGFVEKHLPVLFHLVHHMETVAHSSTGQISKSDFEIKSSPQLQGWGVPKKVCEKITTINVRRRLHQH